VPCGDVGPCDPATSYCLIFEGGAVLPDGGGAIHYYCNAYPAPCGGTPSCQCLSNAACICDQGNGGFTVTCQAP
jgi:hypothetical protein